MTSWYAIVSFRGQDSPRTCGNFLHRALFCVWEMHLRPQLLLLLATRCENIESIFLSRERGSHWNLWYVQTLVSWSRRRTQFEAATWSSRCFARTWVLKKHLKLNYKGAVRILCQSRGGWGGSQKMTIAYEYLWSEIWTDASFPSSRLGWVYLGRSSST